MNDDVLDDKKAWGPREVIIRSRECKFRQSAMGARRTTVSQPTTNRHEDRNYVAEVRMYIVDG